MSKIYEALQRAEQERAARVDGIGVAVHPQEDAPPEREQMQPDTAEALPVTGSNNRPQVNVRTEAQQSAFARSESTTTAATSQDFGQSEIWNPVAAKLPALQPRGGQVEQFRGLRTKLYEFRSLNTLRSVLVSSALPSEGKSFVAVNLAISFALHKSARVLLIDGDLRRSVQHKLLGTSNSPGLAEYLAGQVEWPRIIRRGEAADGSPLQPGLASLSMIAAGNAGDKAADLSVSPRFAELLEGAYSQFDWIVVDSSPVTLVSDGANLARHCDGVLFVARAGVTSYEVAQRALLNLQSSTTVGVVLNAITGPSLAQGYYGYDGYGSTNE